MVPADSGSRLWRADDPVLRRAGGHRGRPRKQLKANLTFLNVDHRAI
jgi:hypothetical protein